MSSFLARNALRGPLVAGGATGGVVATKPERGDRKAQRAGEAAAAGVGGQAAFRAAVLSAQKRGHALERTLPEGMSRSQRTKIMRDHRLKFGIEQGDREGILRNPEYGRTYPKQLPGAKYKRFVGQMSGRRGELASGLAFGLPALAAASRDVKKRSGKENAARWALALGGGSAAGAGASTASHKKPDETAGLIAGGLAGQAAYQGHNYALSRSAWKKTRTVSRAQQDKALKPVKRETGAGTAEMYRRFPEKLPGYKTHRYLGWAARGRTGQALGTAATGAGALGGLEAMERKSKVGKGSRVYGYQETTLSPIRATEGAVGVSLVAWGGSRLKLGGVADYGQRLAEKHGGGKEARAAIELATSLGAKTRSITGRGEQSVRGIKQVANAIDKVPANLRPAVATTVGAILAANARPIHNRRFVRDARGVR